MQCNDLTWLAGLLEGEGSFLSGPPCKPNRAYILLAMTDLDVVERAAELLEVKAVVTRRFPAHTKRNPIYVINLYGSRAIRAMRTLLPLMSNRRSTQIKTAIKSYQPARRTRYDHTVGIDFSSNKQNLPIERDINWLAGILEAEGSFMSGPASKPNRPRIQVALTDEDVISWIATWFSTKYTPLKPRQNEPLGRKPVFMACVASGHAVAMMNQLYPLLGKRRQAQIERALASYDPNFHKRNTTKLLDEQVMEIYRRAHSGERQATIATEFSIDRTTVADIKRGKSWGWLTNNADKLG